MSSVLIVGLTPNVSPAYAQGVKDQLQDKLPGIDVIVVTGATAMTVIDADTNELPSSGT